MKFRLLRPAFLFVFSLFAVAVGFSQNQSSACFLTLQITGLDSIECPGTFTGGVYLGVAGAQGSVQYVIDGTGVYNQPSITNAVAAGLHTVIATDAMGCMDTVMFVLPDPPGMNISASEIDAVCNGDNSGSVSVVANGGAQPYTVGWQNCSGGAVYSMATVQNLYAGCYNVTVTDSKGCTKTDQINVGEPAAFVFNSSQDSVDCYGTATGSGTIFVTGGTAPYGYMWQNGQTTPTATGLMAGFPAVTVTDANNCSAVTLVPVFQPANLTATSTKTDILCAGDSTGTMTVLTTAGGTKPYSYAWSAGVIAPNKLMASKLPGGFAHVTITDWHGCTVEKTESINQPNAIQINTMVKNEVCEGACDGEITVTAAFGTPPYSYGWSSPALGTTSNPKNVCPGTYTLTLTDANSCTKTATVTVAAGPSITIQLTPTAPKCSNSSDGQITAMAFGGNSGFTYKWSNMASTPTITGLAAGNFTVTATDMKGCTKAQTTNLMAPAALIIDSVSISSSIKCFGQTGSLKAYAKGGTGNFTYKWSDPLSQIMQTATMLVAGSYTVTVTDANGCSTNQIKVLSQPTVLAATVAPTDVKCFGDSNGKAVATPTGGTTPYLYAWSNAATTATASNLAAGMFVVTITDKNGCTTTASTTVGGPATALDVQASQTNVGCSGKMNGEAQAVASGGNGAPFMYKWSNMATNALVTGLAAGNFTVTATDMKGCTATKTLTINELSPITLSVATVGATCFGTNNGSAAVNIISGGAGNGTVAGYNYFWSTQPAQTTALASGLMGGSVYQVTATDSKGCTGTASATIPSPQQIVVTMAKIDVSCFGGNDGQAQVANFQGSNPAASYAWSANAPGATGAIAANVQSGQFDVTVTDTKGCTATGSVLVEEPTQLSATFMVKQPLCPSDATGKIEAIGQGGTPNYTFAWSNGSTDSGLRDLKAGDYLLTLTDSRGCTIVDKQTISEPNPIYPAVFATPVSCFGEKDGRIKISVAGGTPPLTYSIDSVTYSGNSTFIGLAARWYTVFIKDGNGCITRDTQQITEPMKIDVDLGPDISIVLGDSVLLAPTVTNGQGILSLDWKPAYSGYSNCTDSTCLFYLVKPIRDISIRLLVEDENGCRADDLLLINVEKPRGVFVPTGFTPNDDTQNDRLMVFGKSRTVKEITVFRIYDRWGELLYEDENFKVNDDTHGWDGKFRGNDMPAGEYVWRLEVEYVDGFKQSLKGSTVLIR